MESIEEFELIGARGSGERAEAPSVSGGDTLGDGVVVVSPDGAGRIGANPFDAGERVRSVIDDVSQKEAGIECFLDRGECGPVGMDVGENEDFHGRKVFVIWLRGGVSFRGTLILTAKQG